MELICLSQDAGREGTCPRLPLGKEGSWVGSAGGGGGGCSDGSWVSGELGRVACA